MITAPLRAVKSPLLLYRLRNTDDPVTNVSSALNLPFKFKGGSYPGVGGTCGTGISSDCTVVVNFEPASAGNFSQVLSLNCLAFFSSDFLS